MPGTMHPQYRPDPEDVNPYDSKARKRLKLKIKPKRKPKK